MSKVPYHPEAFSLTSGRKRPRVTDGTHLAFIRTLICIVPGCAWNSPDAAHIRYASPAYGKPMTGAGIKPNDCYTVPLCRTHHAEQHGENERQWWRRIRVDPLRVACALYCVSGDREAGLLICMNAA